MRLSTFPLMKSNNDSFPDIGVRAGTTDGKRMPMTIIVKQGPEEEKRLMEEMRLKKRSVTMKLSSPKKSPFYLPNAEESNSKEEISKRSIEERLPISSRENLNSHKFNEGEPVSHEGSSSRDVNLHLTSFHETIFDFSPRVAKKKKEDGNNPAQETSDSSSSDDKSEDATSRSIRIVKKSEHSLNSKTLDEEDETNKYEDLVFNFVSKKAKRNFCDLINNFDDSDLHLRTKNFEYKYKIDVFDHFSDQYANELTDTRDFPLLR